MPGPEYSPTIPSREAISKITNSIIEQRRVEGKDTDGLSSLNTVVLGIFQTFRVGDVPVERDIFRASETSPLLPEINVDEVSRTISIDGRNIKFSTENTKGDGSYWKMLLYFLKHANTDIDKSTTLKEISEEVGIAVGRTNIKACVRYLRKRMEDDPYDPKILTTVRNANNRVGYQKYSYRLNATVKFTGESFTPEIIKTTPLLLPVGRVEVQPVKEAKNSSGVVVIDSIDQLPEEIRRELEFYSPSKNGEMGKTLLKILNITSEKKPIAQRLLFNIIYGKNVNGDLSRADTRTLYGMIATVKQEIKSRDLTIMSKTIRINEGGQELKKSVCWLTSIDDFRRAREKTKANETLKLLRTASEKTPFSYEFLTQRVFGEASDKNIAAMRSIFLCLKRMLEKSGEVIRSVSLNIEPKKRGQPKLVFWIAKKDSQVLEDSTPPVKQETIFVKEDPPKETNFPKESLDKPPVLAIAQIAALAIIFQGPMCEEVLKQYGIIIIKNELRLKAVKDIVVKCRRLMGGGEFTEIFLRESFPALAKYLKEFVEGDREAFIRSNNDRAQTLLKMIPAKITVDNLGHLMDEIGKIINR